MKGVTILLYNLFSASDCVYRLSVPMLGYQLANLPTPGYEKVWGLGSAVYTQDLEQRREEPWTELPGQKECMRPAMCCQVSYLLENMCLRLVRLVAMLTTAAELAIPANQLLDAAP